MQPTSHHLRQLWPYLLIHIYKRHQTWITSLAELWWFSAPVYLSPILIICDMIISVGQWMCLISADTDIPWKAMMKIPRYHSWIHFSADFKLAPNQLETSLQSTAASHWLGANLKSAPHLLSYLDSYSRPNVSLCRQRITRFNMMKSMGLLPDT